MSHLIDYKYANLLSGRLTGFKISKTNPYLANFKCPLCIDQTTRKKKAYIFQGDKCFIFKCHKCAVSTNLGQFLKRHHPDLYSEYTFEEFTEKTGQDRVSAEPDPILNYTKPKYETSGTLKGIKRISQLAHNHPAKKYVEKRLIPTEAHARLYFVKNFTAWINTLLPGKYKEVPEEDPRLVMPLIDRKGNMFAVQGRALTKKQTMRYITIRFDEGVPKLFGLDKVDPNRRVYVVEGPIDSLFLPNAIALAGSECDVDSILEYTGTTKERLIHVLDNEPRNVNIHNRMYDLMDAGYQVCIWPSYIKEKDINAMIKDGGMNAADVQLIIDNNLFTGLMGRLQMASWVKTNA